MSAEQPAVLTDREIQLLSRIAELSKGAANLMPGPQASNEEVVKLCQQMDAHKTETRNILEELAKSSNCSAFAQERSRPWTRHPSSRSELRQTHRIDASKCHIGRYLEPKSFPAISRESTDSCVESIHSGEKWMYRRISGG